MNNQVWYVYDGWILYTEDSQVWAKLKNMTPIAVYKKIDQARIYAKQYKFSKEQKALLDECLNLSQGSLF